MGYVKTGSCSCNNQKISQTQTEQSQSLLAQIEDQTDYQFIQRIIQEVTQSCAMPLPIPASAIPPLILQAAQYFWENYDFASQARYYCLPFGSMTSNCGPNRIFKLPDRIISVYGVYKTSDIYHYGAIGDFSLERMVLSNSLVASGMGGSLNNVFGGGDGWNLTDVTGALYEISTYKAMFDAPLTYEFNPYSHILNIMGNLGHSDLILECYLRCKVQDLYGLYYFFRYCVCLALRSLSTIMGTFEFKLVGGVTLNYQKFSDAASTEMAEIHEWVKSQRAPYFLNSNTI